MKKRIQSMVAALAAVGASLFRKPRVEFVNIADGTFADGVKSFYADAVTTERYLLYKAGATSNDYVQVCGAGETPFGSSDDLCDDTGVPIAVKLFGAVKGTVRVVTDGTCTHGNYVKAAASGRVALASNGDVVVGLALIPTDQGTTAAGDVIEIIPILPAKHAF